MSDVNEADDARPDVSAPHYEWDGFGFDTRQVHAGETPEPGHNARITPVYLSAEPTGRRA